LALLGSIGRWGRLFDRVGVLRFRVVNVACWAVSLALGAVATLAIVHLDWIGPGMFPMIVLLFAVRGLFNGLGLGGGALAWNIGHLHFARPDEAEVYMGIHVSLTGIRGLFAPLVGIWLWNAIGWMAWLVALVLCLGGLVIFWWMARSEENGVESAVSEGL